MRRQLFMVSIGLMALALAGCCGNNMSAVAAKPNTCGRPVYQAPNCAQTRETVSSALDHLNTITFGCDQPVALALPSEHCSPADLPKDAKPGEVWCCVKVQPPAAAPRQVCVCDEQTIEIPVAATYKTVSKQVLVSAERTEWQRTDCQHVDENDCWKLAVIPAVYQTITEEQMVTPPLGALRGYPGEVRPTGVSAPSSVLGVAPSSGLRGDPEWLHQAEEPRQLSG